MTMIKRMTALVLVMVFCFGCMTAFAEYEELKVGSKGEAVVALQEHLILFGYLSGKADGAYGKGTAASVKAFQKDAGLEQTGVADAATQEALFAKELPEILFRGAKLGSTAAEALEALQASYKPNPEDLFDGYPHMIYTVDAVCDIIEVPGRDSKEKNIHTPIAVAYYELGGDEVAGHEVWNKYLLFVNPVKDGALAASKDDYIFYGGKYMIGTNGNDKAVMDDLTEKLTALYGKHVESKGKRIWKGANDVEVVLFTQEHMSGAVGLAYVWTGADAVLEETYAFLDAIPVAQEDNSNNFSGL